MQHPLLRSATLFLFAFTASTHTTSKIEILKSGIRWTPHVMMMCAAGAASIITSSHYFGFKPIAVADHPKAIVGHTTPQPHLAPAPAEAAVEIPKLRSQWILVNLFLLNAYMWSVSQFLAHYAPITQNNVILKGARKTPSMMLCITSTGSFLISLYDDCYNQYPFTHYSAKNFVNLCGWYLGLMGCTAFFAYACYLA